MTDFRARYGNVQEARVGVTLYPALFAFLLILTLMETSAAGQVSVSATAGTIGPTAYTTLKAAFDAVNLGTHQGTITISITGDTAETATAALFPSGSGVSS